MSFKKLMGFGSIAALMISIVTTSATSAAAKGALERIKKEGKLLVAIDATYPPMESEGPDGKPPFRCRASPAF